jgi:WD40 repeat protein
VLYLYPYVVMQFPSGMLESMCEQKLSTLRMMQNYVVTGGYDKTVRLWDARTGALLRTFIGHNSAVSRVIFNPLGNLVISGCVIAQPGLSIGLGGRSEIMIC